MKAMFEDAKVGDRVWSLQHGWGTITNLCHKDILVRFDCSDPRYPHMRSSFTYDGKILEHHVQPTLFWDEVKIEPPPKPKRLVEKTGWINVYLDTHKTSIKQASIWSSKEVAQRMVLSDCGYVDTIQITWMEEEE